MILLDILMAVGFAIMIFFGLWLFFLLIMFIVLAAGAPEAAKQWDELNDVPIQDRRK